MGKFTGSTVQPGQVDQATQTTIETPVQQIQEKTPQAQGSAFEAILNQKAASPEAAASEISAAADVDPDIAAQQERERVPALGERFQQAETASPKWKTTAPTDTEITDTKSGVQNLRARSKKLVDLVNNKQLSGGWGIGSNLKTPDGQKIKDIYATQGPEAGQQALLTANANSPAAIFQSTGATEITETGTQVDPQFIATLSAVTENFMMGAQTASEGGAPKEKIDQFSGEAELERPDADYEFSKAQGNSRLGTDIHREYQRVKNQREGRPTDQYNDLTPTQATVLGDLAKEIFAEANPDLIKRTEGTLEDPVKFMVTAQGVDVLSKSAEARKRLFPTTNTRPSKTILPKGELVGEGQKLTRKRTTKAGDLGNTRLIDEAMENLHSVPNVVDPRRSRVLLATALPAMLNAIEGKYDGTWNNVAGVGINALNDFTAAKALADRKNEKARLQAAKNDQPFFPTNYDVKKNMDSLVDTLAQSIRAVAQERNGANYLTYAMQSFTGRVHPQQTYFDPTASKIVRFATRNATPVIAKPGSRQEANLKQMYAMMLAEGASEALPKQRLEILKIQGPKLANWGKQVKEALDAQIPAALAEQVAQAIDQNIPLTDPRFPQVPELKLPAEITSYINSKSEDALSVLEGLVDYHEFTENYKNGKPHASYFNAYMDGKTNGIANNGIQLGVKEVAERTGVMRSDKAKTLLDDGDIRAALADRITEVEMDGIPGTIENKGPIYDLIKLFGQKKGAARDLQKDTTMQFGYGKELDSFKSNIDESIEKRATSDPDFKLVYDRALNEVGNPDKLRDIVHGVYMDALVKTLSADAADARAVMRANATMFGLMDEIFSIKGPSGFNINIAGTDYELDAESDVHYTITKDGQRLHKAAAIGQRKDTSAAERGGTPGLYAYGRSLPAPIQSLDAYTVAKTVSGRSWEKLKQNSGGNPYIHTIYDAFKVDANGYDVVLEEANKNWLNGSFDWSYLEEAKNAYEAQAKKFWSDLKKMPGDKVLSAKDHGGVRMADYLMTAKGDRIPLTNKIAKTTFHEHHTAEEHGKHAKALAEKAMQVLIKMGYKPGSGSMTVDQYRWFFQFMHKNVYNLGHKNSSIVSKTNAKKADLRKQIDPKKVYQYYSH